MLDVLGQAFLSTIATIVIMAIALCFLSMFFYMLDHWDDYADFIKAAGVCLLIFIAWFTIFASYRYSHTPQNNVGVQVEDDAQTTAR
jgi:protein-S-isoprenylcysteine O-methyltransferase Ste14